MTYIHWTMTGVCAGAAFAVALWLRRWRRDAEGRAASVGTEDEAFLERMRHVVQVRPARERLVFMLIEAEGLSEEDTAHVLGIPIEQVVALHRSVRGALYAAADGAEEHGDS